MELQAVREVYDRDLRMRPFQGGLGHSFAWDRGCFRFTGPGPGVEENGVIFARLDDREADEAIAAQIAHFGSLGHAFEWKLHDYDLPSDLRRRLLAAGLRAETEETVVARPLDGDDGETRAGAPAGVTVAEIEDDAGFAGLEALMVAVYGDERHAAWLVGDLMRERRETPDSLRLWTAQAGGEMVSAGWLRLHQGTRFASLWGGATVAEWRGRGLYGHLVGLRLAVARRAGYRYVTVDCSADSLPILERRGFRRLAVVTPMIWQP